MGPTGCESITRTERGLRQARDPLREGAAESYEEGDGETEPERARGIETAGAFAICRLDGLERDLGKRKVKRSCAIHCRWTSESRHRFARKSAIGTTTRRRGGGATPTTAQRPGPRSSPRQRRRRRD